MTSSERTSRTSPSSSSYWRRSWPGRSWQRATTRASRRSRSVTSCALAALAVEPEPDPGAVDRRVAVAQRREAERLVEPGVLLVADPDQRQLEQPDDRRQHLLAGQARAAEVRVDALADRRQEPGEGEHPVELRAVAVLAERRVVAVLLAAPGVATRRLQVAARVGADPDVRPGGRDREGADPRDDGRVADRRAVGCPVREAPAGAPPRDPGLGVRRPAEAGLRRRLAAGVRVLGHAGAPLGCDGWRRAVGRTGTCRSRTGLAEGDGASRGRDAGNSPRGHGSRVPCSVPRYAVDASARFSGRSRRNARSRTMAAWPRLASAATEAPSGPPGRPVTCRRTRRSARGTRPQPRPRHRPRPSALRPATRRMPPARRRRPACGRDAGAWPAGCRRTCAAARGAHRRDDERARHATGRRRRRAARDPAQRDARLRRRRRRVRHRPLGARRARSSASSARRARARPRRSG